MARLSLTVFSTTQPTHSVLILLFFVAFSLVLYGFLKPQLKFIWHCFLRPLGTDDHQTRLDEFYRGQAEIYDKTRAGLLRGRNTMLSLSASHLRIMRASSKRLVWVDIGGGTGYNLDLMDKYLPISSFDAVYVIDLCEPLLEVARKRCAARGWKNVTVLCQDASQFTLPEWTNNEAVKGSVGFISMSYSLSMIPGYYAVLDRIDYVLSPQDGLLAVVDFYTSGKQSSLHDRTIGGISKECGWLSRWFWQIWFDFDHISLGPARRSYLEYKFGTIKSYNGRNRFILPFIVRIPYYIWLGRPRSCDVAKACHAFEIEGGNLIGNCSPTLPTSQDAEECIPALKIGEPAFSPETRSSAQRIIDITPPLSSFHYQIHKPWRLPYYENPIHKEFRTFIYSFTWEDPFEDMRYLNLTPNDSMFVITSAGDNALHYAVEMQPKRIHCVDVNPCQGHLLELKLAAIRSLEYDDFFAMFGAGHHPNFRLLLDSKIAPYLSSVAYQFWRRNDDAFSSAFYLRGYSGWALRLARVVFSLAGVTKDVQALCSSNTIQEQEQIWNTKLRPVLLNPVVVALLKSPVFCWNALGVPLNQRQMILEEGTFYDFICHTLDPLASTYLFKTGNYFYLLVGPSGTLYVRIMPLLPDALRLRSIEDGQLNSLRLVPPSHRLYRKVAMIRLSHVNSLTRVILMDHLDWFSPGSNDVIQEVAELNRVVAAGGSVHWRSASRKPWYNEVFKQQGFSVSAIAVRNGKKAIDKVNMYASCWLAVKTL